MFFLSIHRARLSPRWMKIVSENFVWIFMLNKVYLPYPRVNKGRTNFSRNILAVQDLLVTNIVQGYGLQTVLGHFLLKSLPHTTNWFCRLHRLLTFTFIERKFSMVTTVWKIPVKLWMPQGKFFSVVCGCPQGSKKLSFFLSTTKENSFP